MPKGKLMTVDASPLVGFMKSEELSTREAAEIFGVSTSSIQTWSRKGRCPKSIVLAIEGLRRRRRNGNDHSLLLVAGPPAKIDVLRRVAEATGLKHARVEIGLEEV